MLRFLNTLLLVWNQTRIGFDPAFRRYYIGFRAHGLAYRRGSFPGLGSAFLFSLRRF